MKIYEIVIGMYDNKYENGDMFENADMGDILIHNDELLWADDLTPFSIMLGDDSDWEKV